MRPPEALNLVCTSPNWPSNGGGLHGRLLYGRRPRGVNINDGMSRSLTILDMRRGLHLIGWAECGTLTLWPGGVADWTDETKARAEELARELVGKRGRFVWVANADAGG